MVRVTLVFLALLIGTLGPRAEAAMHVAESIDGFLAEVGQRLAKKTHASYTGRLRSLVAMHGELDLAAMTRAHVDAWLGPILHGQGDQVLAPDTQRAAIVAFVQWQKWAVEHGQLAAPIVDKIKKPQGRQRERIPTRGERAAVLKIASPAFARIYRCLIYTGARPNELARATIDEYDRGASLIVLRDHKTAKKSGKTRRIGIGRKIQRIVARSIDGRTGGLIFLNDHGRRWTSETLSHTYRKLRIKAGLSDDLVLYCTRHAAGTEICKQLGIYAAKHALGHADIQTTQRYCHLDDAELLQYQDQMLAARRRQRRGK
jgi:integrase